MKFWGYVVSALISALILSAHGASLAFAQGGPTSGPNGFNWIGTNPDAVTMATCVPAFLDVTGQWEILSTSWTPPGAANFSYRPTSFTAIVGTYPNDVGLPFEHPAAVNTGYNVYIHDSFSNLTANPNQGYRASYHFTNAHASLVQLPNSCQFCFGTTCSGIPCWRLTVDLAHPDSVSYRDAAGLPTTTPFQLSGGVPYWVSLAPLQRNGANSTPCAVHTNETIPEYVSPRPNPPLSLAMTEYQCNDGQISHPPGSGCSFPLAHSDLYMIIPDGTFPLCSRYGSFVNWIDSDLEPRWNPSFASPYRHCGWPTGGSPCCNRTFKGRSAYAMTTVRSKSVALSAVARAIDDCQPPNC